MPMKKTFSYFASAGKKSLHCCLDSGKSILCKSVAKKVCKKQFAFFPKGTLFFRYIGYRLYHSTKSKRWQFNQE